MESKLTWALAAALVAGCVTTEPPPTTLPELRPGYVAGYLEAGQLPDSVLLLPGPPAAGSPSLAADEAIHKATRGLRDGPRWAIAIQDADLRFPHAGQTFACVLGTPVSEAATPHLNMLLRRVRMDASRANDKAKDHFKRARPFMVTQDKGCETGRPGMDSYPSGHASIGWAWALALAELAPDRANAILGRGLEYGTSRVVCGMHWMSDVEAGRIVGASTVSRLHAEPVFVAQMAHAKKEIEAARAAGAKPSRDCAAEARALSP
jgi:acid phosphatase (class A)